VCTRPFSFSLSPTHTRILSLSLVYTHTNWTVQFLVDSYTSRLMFSPLPPPINPSFPASYSFCSHGRKATHQCQAFRAKCPHRARFLARKVYPPLHCDLMHPTPPSKAHTHTHTLTHTNRCHRSLIVWLESGEGELRGGERERDQRVANPFSRCVCTCMDV